MKRTTKKRSLIIIVVVALLWPIVAWAAGESLIVRSEISRADAIVVLAGSSTYDQGAQNGGGKLGAGCAPTVGRTEGNISSDWRAGRHAKHVVREPRPG